MIRTSLSFLMLCTCLFVASKVIHQSIAAEKTHRHTSSKAARVTTVSMPFITAFDLTDNDNESDESSDTAWDESENPPLTKAETQPAASESTTTTQSDDDGKLESTEGSAKKATEEQADPSTTRETSAKENQSTDGAPSETKVAPDSNQANKENQSREQTVELTPQLVELREQVRDCLGYYYNRHENVVDHSPWGIMHVLIAYGVDTEVIGNGRKINAIGWLCWNGSCRGQQLFYTQGKKLQTRLGPGVQGHDGQFLAMMAQSRVKTTYPMRVDGQDFTIADLIEHEKLTCQSGTELTFKLIGLAHYLDSTATWKNESGDNWSIPRLIKEELAQSVVNGACGGTHRMMGFTYAVRKREKENKPVDGQWQRAKKYLDDYFDYTFYLQNEDGSFSTDFFRGRNGYGDINRRIETTGHILEWFVASLSDEQLRDPRVIKSVTYLTKLMLDNKNYEWEIGPKGHALHGLAIYSERVFRDKPGQRAAVLARGRKASADAKKR